MSLLLYRRVTLTALSSNTILKPCCFRQIDLPAKLSEIDRLTREGT
jgi:hypothetical protein